MLHFCGQDRVGSAGNAGQTISARREARERGELVRSGRLHLGGYPERYLEEQESGVPLAFTVKQDTTSTSTATLPNVDVDKIVGQQLDERRLRRRRVERHTAHVAKVEKVRTFCGLFLKEANWNSCDIVFIDRDAY